MLRDHRIREHLLSFLEDELLRAAVNNLPAPLVYFKTHEARDEYFVVDSLTATQPRHVSSREAVNFVLLAYPVQLAGEDEQGYQLWQLKLTELIDQEKETQVLFAMHVMRHMEVSAEPQKRRKRS